LLGFGISPEAKPRQRGELGVKNEHHAARSGDSFATVKF